MAPFFPGNSEAEIDRLESVIGRTLPPDVREFLSLQGGQDDPDWTNGLFNLEHFMTIEEMIADYRMLQDVSEDWAEPAEQPSYYSMDGWSPGWLKFMSFQGDGHTIDLAPGELGHVGQVFERPNVPDLEDPVAGSIEEFLELVRTCLREGDYDIKNGSVWLNGL